MLALAVDVAAFSGDLEAGRLALDDLPRLAREYRTAALDVPAPLLVQAPAARRFRFLEEARRCGTLVAAARADTLAPGDPTFVADTFALCGTLCRLGYGHPLLVLRPPAVQEAGPFGALAAALGRARRACAEWDMGLALGAGGWRSCVGLAQSVRGVHLAPDLDLLPVGPERSLALGSVLPHAQLVRVLALGTPSDAAALGLWPGALRHFGGLVSVRYAGGDDPYSGVGTAIGVLRKAAPA